MGNKTTRETLRNVYKHRSFSDMPFIIPGNVMEQMLDKIDDEADILYNTAQSRNMSNPVS